MLRRSALFVPAGVERRYRRAAASGADLIVLDLEDAVPPDGKDHARAQIGPAREAIGRPAIVRVNAGPALLAADLAACAASGVTEILLPKVESAQDVVAARELCARHGGWQPTISILVESLAAVRGLPGLLAGAGALGSVALGLEDLSAELLLAAPGPRHGLDWLHAQLLLWAGSAGATPVGLFGDIANFTDLAEFGQATAAAWQAGYRGTYCIHPAQVPVANAAYAPAAADVRWAAEVLAAAAAAGERGEGVVAVGGRMADAPTVARAQRIIDYDQAVRGVTPALRVLGVLGPAR
jgi:citrate lyase subunit beta/citryl-CoA lyase